MVNVRLAKTSSNSHWFFLTCNNKSLPKVFFIENVCFTIQINAFSAYRYPGNLVCYAATINYKELSSVVKSFLTGAVYSLPSCIFLGFQHDLTLFTYARLQTLIDYLPGFTTSKFLRNIYFPAYLLISILLLKIIQNYLLLYKNA